MVEKGEIPCCWFFGNFLLCCCFSPFLYYEEYKQKQINNDKEILVPLHKQHQHSTTSSKSTEIQKGIKQNFVKEVKVE
jgi:hypothetical protein